MSYVNPFEDEEEYGPSSNYFVRHWKGQNSLPFAYWVNGSLVNLGLVGGVNLLQDRIENSDASLRIMATTGLILILVSLIAWVWSSVGIWRSATRHPYRGGSGGWATVAKGILILGCLGMVARTPNLFLLTRELGQLAAGNDPLGKSASITMRPGGVMQVDGFLSQGFADRFATALKANPGVRVLALNSPGGRIVEGERFARQAKDSGLDTIVEGECSSACILPFLAGKNRLLGANARLGFHQPTAPGASQAERQEGIDAFRDSMIKAGVSRSFSYQALTAAPDDMWYPDLRTLFEAGVVTGLDRSAIVSDNEISAKSLNRNLPKRLDAYTSLTGVRANGTMLEYSHEVTIPAAQVDAGAQGKLREAVTNDVCSNPEIVMMVKAGAIYRYIYRDSRGIVVAQFDIARC